MKYQEEIIYYDFETTGLNQYHDKIIEYAFIKNEESLSSLIDPETELTPKIQKITNITDDMLKNQPKIWTELPKIIKFINKNKNNSKYLIAHNNDGFDKIFLINLFNKYDYDYKKFNLYFIDTLLLAKKILPNIPSYSLKSLLIYFKIESKNLHRAHNDILALKLVYQKLCGILHEKINIEYQTLIDTPSIVYDYLY